MFPSSQLIWPCLTLECAVVFDHFEPLSLSSLQDIITQLNASAGPTDFVPPKFFIEMWDTIGPSILTIINSSLNVGIVPS